MKRSVLTCLFAAAVSTCAFAQAPWPAKPVKIIAVFPPGGSVDQVARVFCLHFRLDLLERIGELEAAAI